MRAGFTELLGWTGEDLYPVDFALCSYMSTFLPGRIEKPWGALVGGPGSGKSQILKMFNAHPRTVSINHFTEAAFTSAYVDPEKPNADFSVLSRLSPQSNPLGPKILVIHEMSSVLQGRIERSNKLLADLRAAFDGEFGSAGGTTGLRKYETNFGLLIASTEVLDEYLRTNQTLGERTLICRTGRQMIQYAHRRKVARQAFATNRISKAEIETRVADTVAGVIDAAIDRAKDAIIEVPPDLEERTSMLANLATTIRTCPLKYSYVSTPEAPTRLPQQVRLWGDTRAMVDGRTVWDMSDFLMARRIAMDTMPPDHWRLFDAVYRGDPRLAITPITRTDLAHRAKVELEFAKRQMHQWTILDFMVQCSGDGESYSMKPEVAADASVSLYAKEER